MAQWFNHWAYLAYYCWVGKLHKYTPFFNSGLLPIYIIKMGGWIAHNYMSFFSAGLLPVSYKIGWSLSNLFEQWIYNFNHSVNFCSFYVEFMFACNLVLLVFKQGHMKFRMSKKNISTNSETTQSSVYMLRSLHAPLIANAHENAKLVITHLTCSTPYGPRKMRWIQI